MRKFLFWTRPITTITEAAKTQRHLIKPNCQLANLTRLGQCQDALHLFGKIQSFIRPDEYTLSTTLTACANLRITTFGNKIHAYAVKSGLKSYLHVSNNLLLLYAKTQDIVSVKWVFGEIENPDVYSYTTLLSACMKMGHVGFAFEVFDRMLQRDVDVALWNAMISGCMGSRNEEIGFELFRDMCRLGVKHDNYSFATVLSRCCSELVDFGRQVHVLVIKTGFLVRTSVVNSLITMYFNCENVVDACLVFEEAQHAVVDQVTYNVMIDGLVDIGRVEEAFMMLKEMLRICLSPTELTFVSSMSSCLNTRIGYQVHAQTIKMGFEAYTSVSNVAITMYSSCGDLYAASMIFGRIEEKDLVSWNAMISSYAQNNFGRSAILAYLEMLREGIQPDEFTFGSLLASSKCVETVEMIHALLLGNGLISNIQVSNALISSYSKHGNMTQAYQIFLNMVCRNLISWNAVISGFFLNGLPLQGLEQFSKLLMSEFKPNECTLTITLSICASISDLRLGMQIHDYIIRFGFTPKGSLGNALITMYAKCGLLDWSLRVFNSMTEKDIVSWNALISAYAQHGLGKEAVNCFEAIENSTGVKPDSTTFTAILSACSHAGLVDKGTQIFNTMIDKYMVVPGVDHFSCIIDLLGRAGYFDEVEKIINSEHFKAHPNILWTLFSACVSHGNLKLGRLVAGLLIEVEGNNPSVYVLLSNMYTAAGQWEEAANVRHLMNDTGVIKQCGLSWISS